jgi:hypothetical protein
MVGWVHPYVEKRLSRPERESAPILEPSDIGVDPAGTFVRTGHDALSLTRHLAGDVASPRTVLK